MFSPVRMAHDLHMSHAYKYLHILIKSNDQNEMGFRCSGVQCAQAARKTRVATSKRAINKSNHIWQERVVVRRLTQINICGLLCTPRINIAWVGGRLDGNIAFDPSFSARKFVDDVFLNDKQ